MLQLVFKRNSDALVLTCYTLAGDEVLQLEPHGSELASDLHRRLAGHLNQNLQSLRLVLPDGQLLAKIYRANPAITVADINKIQ